MDKIFITGINGFVGENLKKYLKNFECIGVSRNSHLSQNVLSYNNLMKRDDGFAIVHLAGKAHDLKKSVKHEDYVDANYVLTKSVYDFFLKSSCKKFIFISSVKAVKDQVDTILTEEDSASPVTSYGKSKRMAEEYIMDNLPIDKEVYILRPCMIHGPGNKGNLNLLYKFVSKGVPYPLAGFSNRRSFLSVENLCYTIEKLLTVTIPTGIYNVADDLSFSTNEVVSILAEASGKKAKLWRIPSKLITIVAHFGNILNLPFNSERLEKLTENYEVSNIKIKEALHLEKFPMDATDGLILTAKSFK